MAKRNIVGKCVLKHHSNSQVSWLKYGLSFLVLMTLVIMPSYGNQPIAPMLKGKKVEKTHIDPSLKAMEGQLIFDSKSKEALERSKEPGVLLGAMPSEGKVFRIRVIGAHKVEPDAVLLRIKSKVDETFDRFLVSEDIREILKMGLFANVEVWQQVLPSGAVELEYRLQEIPTIFDIQIKGNVALSEEEIKENLAGLENYQVAKLDRLQAAVEKIKELYISKGYYLATVSYSINATSDANIRKRETESVSEKGTSVIEIETAKVSAPDFVDVVFNIKENSRVKINRINFIGNKRLSDDELKADLRSQEEHALSILTDWGTFRRDFLELDVLILEQKLRNKGMLKAKFPPAEVQLSPDKSSISITFRMIEGEQYSLGTVTINGDLIEKNEDLFILRQKRSPERPIFSEKALLAHITQHEGEIFNQSLMGQNILTIADDYRDQGYAYVNVSPIPTFDEDKKCVNIDIHVESGPRVKVERIDIEGNEKTTDEVIRRELMIHEGEFYSSSLVQESERNIQRLNYFESVDLTQEPGSTSSEMVIKINVKEKSTGGIQAGAGYGTGGEGLVLRLQVSNQNLFGRGQTLSATINWSNYRSIFDVMFAEPYLTYIFDQPLSFSFTAFNRDVNLGDFKRSATGGDVTLGYPVGGPFKGLSRAWRKNVRPSLAPYVFDFESLWFLLTYSAERVKISDSTLNVRSYDLHLNEPRYTTSLKPTLRLDQRDNRMFPTRGIFAEFRTEFASEYLGGAGLAILENNVRKKSLENKRLVNNLPATSNNFIRYGANVRLYHNMDGWFPLKGFVLKTNVELGFLNTLGSRLLFENYALGGINSVRGYDYRSISPVESAGALFPFDARRNVAVGGNKQLFGSFELEFPLVKLLKFSGVVFFDFGNVYGESDNLFYVGGKSVNAARIKPSDPLRLYEWLGLYSSVGFGVRWDSPLGFLRFEWGIPFNRRPVQTPGLRRKDPPIIFEFSIGPSF